MKLKKILAAIAACAMSAAMISMTVSAAGVAGDDETLDDSTEVGDDISLDEDEGDEVVDTGDEDEGDEGDETVDNGEEDTQAPAQTATNPQTGNSPIALAVIPVALAAAAVVAKKAK